MLKVVINVELTKHIIDVIDVHFTVPIIDLDKILNAVSLELDIPILDITSISREDILPDVRKLYCLLAKEYTKKSLAKIGKLINRDHATVLYSIKKARIFLKSSHEFIFKNKYNSIKERLGLE